MPRGTQPTRAFPQHVAATLCAAACSVAALYTQLQQVCIAANAPHKEGACQGLRSAQCPATAPTGTHPCRQARQSAPPPCARPFPPPSLLAGDVAVSAKRSPSRERLRRSRQHERCLQGCLLHARSLGPSAMHVRLPESCGGEQRTWLQPQSLVRRGLLQSCGPAPLPAACSACNSGCSALACMPPVSTDARGQGAGRHAPRGQAGPVWPRAGLPRHSLHAAPRKSADFQGQGGHAARTGHLRGHLRGIRSDLTQVWRLLRVFPAACGPTQDVIAVKTADTRGHRLHASCRHGCLMQPSRSRPAWRARPNDLPRGPISAYSAATCMRAFSTEACCKSVGLLECGADYVRPACVHAVCKRPAQPVGYWTAG